MIGWLSILCFLLFWPIVKRNTNNNMTLGKTVLGELGRPFESQSLGATELDGSSDLLHASSETT